MPNEGQEQEKQQIAQIKEMAAQIAQMCDALMQREEQEDKGGESMEQPNTQGDMSAKAEFVRNFKKA
jgi:hypothetical protein